MSGLVLDTHVVIWYLEDTGQLSRRAETEIDDKFASGDPVFVSAVTLAEMIYLLEKGRIHPTDWDRVLDRLRQPASGIDVEPFTLPIAETMQQIPPGVIPEMPDRMIAATALHLELPLVTRDQRIQAANLVTIW